MSTDPSMRASDAERDAVAAQLREAHAEGRLTLEEFDQRLDATYAARTLGDLAALTRDLPVPAGRGREVARRDRHPPARSRDRSSDWLRAAWGAWAAATFVNLVIWGVIGLARGGDRPYFWPIWVAGPWGALLLARTIFGGGAERERPGRRDGEVDHR